MRKEIKGYEGLYEIDRCGDIYDIKSDKTICKRINSYGDVMARLVDKNGRACYFKASRLVAGQFLNNPNNYKYVACIDGNKLNLNANNLMWSNKKNFSSWCKEPMPVNQYDANGVLIARYKSITEASRCIGTGSSLIASCCKGNTKSAYGYNWEYAEA